MEILIIVIVLIFVFILLIALISSFKSSGSGIESPERRFGRKGEQRVANELDALAKRYGGYLFNNYCFKDKQGYSCEIDHILITKGGVFIIETKSNKGKVKGTASDENWLCLKSNYEIKTFKNPTKSNQGHINHLGYMIYPKKIKFYSLVIFPYADISLVNAYDVYTLESAINRIDNQSRDGDYSDHFVNEMHQILKNILSIHGISVNEHIENIKSKHS